MKKHKPRPEFQMPTSWDGRNRKPNGTRKHILMVSRTLLTRARWPHVRLELNYLTGGEVGRKLGLNRVLRELKPRKGWRFEIKNVRRFEQRKRALKQMREN